MKTIGAAKFREQCYSLLDSLGSEGILITKYGRPVARVLPVQPTCASLIGALSSVIEINGDIDTSGEVWEASS